MGNQHSHKQPQTREILAQAEKTGVLQMRGRKLKEIPANVLNLHTNLRNLDLSENKIEILPNFVGQFTNLKQLSLGSNLLTFLPDELGQLVKLEGLSLEKNRILTLPASLSALNNLKTVNLSDNQLTEFPLVFAGLRKLDFLDLSGNSIETVPSGIGSLHVLELNLNRNKINSISEDIADCSRLKILRLEENCLELDVFTPKILKESNVSTLAVSGNVFDEKDLRTLDGYDQFMERFTASKKKMY